MYVWALALYPTRYATLTRVNCLWRTTRLLTTSWLIFMLATKKYGCISNRKTYDSAKQKKCTVPRIQFMLIHYQCCHVNRFDKIPITEVDMASVYLPGR